MNQQINYVELGEQTKKTREELFQILRMSKGIPKSITKEIVSSISKLDSFRCKAEDHMFSKEPNQNTHVFYGPTKK